QIGAVDVVGNARGTGVRPQILGKELGVEPQLFRVADQIFRGEGVLMLEEQIVHLPEGALFRRSLGRLRRDLPMGMDVAQRQMPPDVPHVAELPQELADDGLGPAAVWTLEVAVLDQRDECLPRASEMIALWFDLDVEVDHALGGAEQASDPQAARQESRQAEQQPREDGRAEGRAEDPDLRLLEPLPRESKVRHE